MFGNFFRFATLFGQNRKALGAVPNPLDLRDIQIATFQQPVELPYEYETDLSMIPVQNQKSHGSCVGQAEGTIIAYFDYLENDNIDVSRRSLYALSKQEDGIPDTQGTFPRVCASIVSKKGAVTSKIVQDNNDLPYAEYVNVRLTLGELQTGEKRKANYAFIAPDLNSLKQAIYQNKLISVSLPVDWSAFPNSGLLSAPNPKNIAGYHRVVLYGFKGNTFFGRNSWGAEWGMSGDFSFEFLDYAPYILDALTYTDIPNSLLEDAKNKAYTFTRTLRMGMTGEDVKRLQELLDVSPKTGYFGQITQRAVRRFQQMNGLLADGIVGAKTIEKLNKPAFVLTKLEKAIMQVESNGNLYAIGDKTLVHKAYGCMQIRQGVCDYINSRNGSKIKSEDMLGNLNLSIFVFREWHKYNNPNGTDEDKAKSWNGGMGWKQRVGNPKYASYNQKIDAYWSAVKKLL